LGVFDFGNIWKEYQNVAQKDSIYMRVFRIYHFFDFTLRQKSSQMQVRFKVKRYIKIFQILKLFKYESLSTSCTTSKKHQIIATTMVSHYNFGFA